MKAEKLVQHEDKSELDSDDEKHGTAGSSGSVPEKNEQPVFNAAEVASRIAFAGSLTMMIFQTYLKVFKSELGTFGIFQIFQQ